MQDFRLRNLRFLRVWYHVHSRATKFFVIGFFIFFLTACSSDTEVLEKYPDGSPKKTVEKISEHKNIRRVFYPNGQLQVEKFFTDNLQDSIQYNYNIQGSKTGEISFRAGERNGPTREFYPSGQVSFEGINANGKPDGLSKWYYPNGKIRTTGYRHLLLDTGRWNDFDTLGLIKRWVQYYDIKDSAVYHDAQGSPVSHEAWEQLR